MQPGLFAQIENQWPDGTVSYGTGYAVAPQYVLTARHVLDPAWEQGSPRSRTGKNDSETKITFDSGKVFAGLNEFVVLEDPKLDVALIKLPTPLPEASADCLGSSREIAPDEHWATRGYLELDDSKRVPLKGTTHQFVVGDKQLVLEASSGIAKDWDPKEKGWSGLSGAPVFIDDRIVGVLAVEDLLYSNPRIECEPIAKVLADANVKEALRPGRPDPEEHRDWLCEHVSRLLEQSGLKGEEIEKLAGCVGLDEKAYVPLEEIVQAIFAPEATALSVLDALRDWQEEHPHLDLSAVMEFVIPAFVDWDRIVPELLETQDGFLEMKAADSFVAEVALAREYGAKCSLTADCSARVVRGKRFIPTGAERGFDAKFDELDEVIKEALKQANGQEIGDLLRQRVSKTTKEDELRFARARLRTWAREDQRHATQLAKKTNINPIRESVPPPYVVLISESEKYSELLDEAARHLKKLFESDLAVIRADFRSSSSTQSQDDIFLRVKDIMLSESH